MKILTAILPLLAWSIVASAGMLMPLSLERLTIEAQLVLHGTVLSQSCQRDPEGRIYTKIELEVAEVWKGTLTNRTFIIVHGGGVIGDRRSSVSHQVEFATSEEVVAFLTVNRRGEGVCLGLSQGKFHVWQDAVSKQKRARNPFHGTSEQAAAGIATQASNRIASLSLAELEQRVRGGSR